MPRKILIVDDKATERLYIRKLLLKLDCVVVEAAGGREGQEAALKQKPDLILMDIVMQPVTGYEATRNIKRNEATCNIPVVMISTNGRDPDKFNAQECGADDFIVKPVTPAELTRVMRDLIP